MPPKKIFSALILVTLVILIGCKKDQNLSKVPAISFLRYYKIPNKSNNLDSLVMVEIDFQDGDGDFGLDLKDTMPPFRIGDAYFNNVFVEYFNGVNGVYTQQITGTNDTLNFNDRVADLKPETRNKAIRGTLIIKISPTIIGTPPDAIKLNVFIVDQALNHSNILNIGPIPVNF